MGKAASTMLTSMLCHACVLCWPGSFIISHFPYVYFENEVYYVYILYVSTIKYVTQKKRPTSRAQSEHAMPAIMIKNFINAGRKYAPGVLGLAHAQWRWHWVLACSPFHPFTRLFYLLTRSLLYYGGGAGVGVGHCGLGVFVVFVVWLIGVLVVFACSLYSALWWCVRHACWRWRLRLMVSALGLVSANSGGIGAFGDGVVFVCSLDLLAWGWCWCWRVRRLTCWRWCWCHWACSSLYSIAYQPML